MTTRLTLAVAVVTLATLPALVIGACGGFGGHSSSAPRIPYVGHWAGPWTDQAHGQAGTLDITVASSGMVTGTVVNTTQSMQGSTNGSMDQYGNLSVTFQYPSASWPVGGLVHTQAGHLVGTLTLCQNGTSFGVADLDLTKQ